MDESRKGKLDQLLEAHKAQPVGTGYIDVIVQRDNYRALAHDLLTNDFEIEAISWWEYIEDSNQPPSYAIGGPKSRFYEGWFAETCTDLDELSTTGSATSALAQVVATIENKVLGEYAGKLVSFKATRSLTPAFWLKVDEAWRNVQ